MENENKAKQNAEESGGSDLVDDAGRNNTYSRTYDHYHTTDDSDTNDSNRQTNHRHSNSKKYRRSSLLKSHHHYHPLKDHDDHKAHGILKTSGNNTPYNERSQSPNDKNFKPIETNSNGSNAITLIVDETKFLVDPEIFKQHSNTMLGRMFSSTLENKPNENGEYSVAYGISSTIFKAILDYYKHGVIKCPPNTTIQDLKDACDYLLIPFDGNTIRSHDLRSLLNE